MRGTPTHPDAEPGTGTQQKTVATPPSHDDDLPNSMRINGTKWCVGREYWDAELRDVVELTGIVRRSSWCHTEDINDAPLKLIFQSKHGRSLIDPNNPDGLDNRFTLRRIEDHAGIADEVW